MCVCVCVCVCVFVNFYFVLFCFFCFFVVNQCFHVVTLIVVSINPDTDQPYTQQDIEARFQVPLYFAVFFHDFVHLLNSSFNHMLLLKLISGWNPCRTAGGLTYCRNFLQCDLLPNHWNTIRTFSLGAHLSQQCYPAVWCSRQ